VSKKNLSDSAHTKLPDEKPGIESLQTENIKEKAPNCWKICQFLRRGKN